MTRMTAGEYRAYATARWTEGELLESVLDLARALDLRTMHMRPARSERGWRTPLQGDGVGWPDLVVVGRHGLLFRELKSSKGRLRPAQEDWLIVLDNAGQDTGIWRPVDWSSGRIRLEMEALR